MCGFKCESQQWSTKMERCSTFVVTPPPTQSRKVVSVSHRTHEVASPIRPTRSHSSRTRRHNPSKSGGLKVFQEESWRSYDHRWSTPLTCGLVCEDEVHCVWLPRKRLSSYVTTLLYLRRDLEDLACWSPAHPQRWAEPFQNSPSAPSSHLLVAILVGRAAWSSSERQRVCRSRVSRYTIEARSEAPSC